MSFAGGIMSRDIARQSQSLDGQLGARGTSDQKAIDDFNFQEKNGLSRTAFAERNRQFAADDAREAVLESVEGEPPVGLVSDIVGALRGSPQRARMARFVAWRDGVAGELAALVAMRDRLQTAIDAPESLRAKRSGLLQQQAKRLLDFIGLGGDDAETNGFDVLQRRELDKEVDSAEHK